MLHSVFERAMHDQRRSLLAWAIGVVLYTAMIVAVYPMIRDRPDFECRMCTCPSDTSPDWSVSNSLSRHPVYSAPRANARTDGSSTASSL